MFEYYYLADVVVKFYNLEKKKFKRYLHIQFFFSKIFIQLQIKKMTFISIANNNTNNCLFFFYFFIGCYIICVSFLIYILIRLLKYYLRQRRINEIINNRLPTTTVLLKIHNISEQDRGEINDELDVFQPLIIKMQDLPPIYMGNNRNEPPPDYKEHL
jgi:hypothetical protein